MWKLIEIGNAFHYSLKHSGIIYKNNTVKLLRIQHFILGGLPFCILQGSLFPKPEYIWNSGVKAGLFCAIFFTWSMMGVYEKHSVMCKEGEVLIAFLL